MIKTPIRLWLAGTTLALGALVSLSAHAAGPFTSMTVFGDSLSDTGNIYLATSGNPGGPIPPFPYFNGRFSDGPVWIDHLATGLGLPAGAVPSLAGGRNFAFGGARTGFGASGPTDPPGILSQVLGPIASGLAGLGAPGSADMTGLYVLVAGGNDMRDTRTANPGNAPADGDARQGDAEAAVGNLLSALGALAQSGAKNVLISNVPDLGRSIEAIEDGVVDASSDATDRFNAEIQSLLPIGQSLGLNMFFLDMAGVGDAVFDDAMNNGGGVYGIKNVTQRCGTFGFLATPPGPGPDCATAGFSDDLHPSAAFHKLIGQAALAAVVPEPQTYALMALGLLLLGAAARRRRMH